MKQPWVVAMNKFSDIEKPIWGFWYLQPEFVCKCLKFRLFWFDWLRGVESGCDVGECFYDFLKTWLPGIGSSIFPCFLRIMYK